jgi:hypothetical protein
VILERVPWKGNETGKRHYGIEIIAAVTPTRGKREQLKI